MENPQLRQNIISFFFIAFFVVIVLVIIIPTHLSQPTPLLPNTGPENLALKKEARSSSWLSFSNTGAQAVDGNLNSYWESNHTLPSNITIYLDRPYAINQIVLKIDPSWGSRVEKIEILGSLDNSSFSQILSPAIYSIAPTATINISQSVYRYIRLVVSSNSKTDSAQLAEVAIFGADPSIHWEIQSIDIMKYSKDVVCNQPSDGFINTQISRAKDLGANFVAISTPYDELPCGSALALTTKLVNAIRAQGLHVWHRHMKSSFEGINDVPKKSNDDPLQTMSDYIINNPTLFAAGDIFTPTPEPDSAGISGVTTCYGVCQFKDNSDFNQWIRNAQLIAKLSFAKIGLPNIKIGYYGTSGFIVFGENNPDWTGKTFLEQRTVDSMGGVIAMDTYPESYGGTMSASLDVAHQVWPTVNFVIGEWGTINIATESTKLQAIKDTMTAAERPYVKGFNYWNLGPSGFEGLLDTNLNPLPAFQTVKDFYNGLR